MLSTKTFLLTVEFIVLLAIFVPTVIAFLTGAPWVPTPSARARLMLKLAKLKKGMVVYDLGCGDGRLVHIAASEYGARATGLELSPFIYFLARIRNFILSSKSKILLRDLRNYSLKDADVVVFYLLPKIISSLRPKFERELKTGARIVSYAFEIPEWEPVYTEPRDPSRHFGRIFVYEIPQSIKPNGIEAKK